MRRRVRGEEKREEGRMRMERGRGEEGHGIIGKKSLLKMHPSKASGKALA